MSWREIGIYIDWLPQESSLRTEIRDQFTDAQLVEMSTGNDSSKHGPWSRLELLSASLINELRQLTYVQLVANGAKDAPKPEPVRTPGSSVPFRKPVDPRAMEYLQAIRARHALEAG